MYYFAYIRLERFYIDTLRLRGELPPDAIAVIHDSQRVVEATPNAVQLGIRRGIRFTEARTLAHGATFVLADPPQWEEEWQRWTQPLREFADQIEVEAPNAAYLDLSRHPDPYPLLGQLTDALPSPHRLGIGRAKWLARLAAFHGGVHADWVSRPQGMLKPLSIHKLPFERSITARLEFLGCRTIGDVQLLGLDILRNQFGELGRAIQLAARGELTDRITANDGPNTVSLVREVSEGITDRDALNRFLRDVAAELADKLAQADRTTRELRARWDEETVIHRFPKPLRTAMHLHLALVRWVIPTSPLKSLWVELPLENNESRTQFSLADSRATSEVDDTLTRLQSAFGETAIQCAAAMPTPRRVQVLKAWTGGMP